MALLTLRQFGSGHASISYFSGRKKRTKEYADQLIRSLFRADICTFYGPWPQFNVRCALSALLLSPSMPFTFSLWANLILCFVWFSHIIKKFYCGNWTRCQMEKGLDSLYPRKIEAPTVFLDIYVKDIVNVCGGWVCVYVIRIRNTPYAIRHPYAGCPPALFCCWPGLFTFIGFRYYWLLWRSCQLDTRKRCACLSSCLL